MWFSIIIGVVEKLFANELANYLENYHKKKVAENVANAPLNKVELLDSFR